MISAEQRSKIMAQIGSKNTKPEIIVRKWLHRRGFRFRLHRADLPGKPDIVLPKFKTIIFIHGCFWHQHLNCKKSTLPKNNSTYWEEKFKRNLKNDSKAISQLQESGWQVIIIWECEVLNGEYQNIIKSRVGKDNNLITDNQVSTLCLKD